MTAGDPGGGTIETLHDMIQIDAPIQPGDSGGALVDADGKVIGMNTAAAGGRFSQQTGSNIGFAIPIDNAIDDRHQIQTGNETDGVHIGARALLGVQVRDVGDSRPRLRPDSAGRLGCARRRRAGRQRRQRRRHQGRRRDHSVDGKTIADETALHLALDRYHPGD